jgi:electron transfer flavoprotein beta subunit
MIVKKKERTFVFLLTAPHQLFMVLTMKILVCIKQVPDPESSILIDNSAAWIKSEEISEFRMSRLDEFALEEAVLIKEAFSDVLIDVISAGPGRATEVIRRSIGMGADAGIHIDTESEGYCSSFEIASWIAEYARDKPYDLILTGAMSEDNMQGQVGPMIAKRLHRSCATAVISEKMAPDRKTIYVEREIEGGNRDTLKLQMPAVLTIQSGINSPRYPSLSNLLRANKQKLTQLHISNFGKRSSPEKIAQIVYPQKTRSGTVLDGTEEEKAKQLFGILRERALLP